MEQEIFDDYIWNEHKKILTADKHKIPGLRNLSHFTPMAPGVPVPFKPPLLMSVNYCVAVCFTTVHW